MAPDPCAKNLSKRADICLCVISDFVQDRNAQLPAHNSTADMDIYSEHHHLGRNLRDLNYHLPKSQHCTDD